MKQHGYWSNTLSDEEYWETIMEKLLDQDEIDNAALKIYIGAEIKWMCQ